jgi:hypothetical protein
MNYDELQVEERIEKAAEYAFLLSSDDVPPPNILLELQNLFNLSEEEAIKGTNNHLTDG